MTSILVALTLLGFQAPTAPAIDNQRVQVRELDGAADSVPYDSVWVSRTGHAAFLKKGDKHAADGAGIMIGLKDFKVEPLVNKTGLPAACPRPGSCFGESARRNAVSTGFFAFRRCGSIIAASASGGSAGKFAEAPVRVAYRTWPPEYDAYSAFAQV